MPEWSSWAAGSSDAPSSVSSRDEESRAFSSKGSLTSARAPRRPTAPSSTPVSTPSRARSSQGCSDGPLRCGPRRSTELGVPFLPLGALMLAHTADDARRLTTEIAANASDLGVPTELLDRAGVRDVAPFLADDVVAALRSRRVRPRPVLADPRVRRHRHRRRCGGAPGASS